MREPELRCPRCGRRLSYDPTMDAWMCPEPDCGLVLRTVVEGDAVDSSIGGGERWRPSEGDEYDWQEERPRHAWRLFAGIIVLLTVAALVAMTLSPLLWPQRTSLHLSPTQLAFTDATESGVMPQALAIQKQGRGRLEWEAWSDAAWLTVEPDSGTLEADLQIITLRVDTTALPEGTYRTALVVAADEAYNSPQTVEVHVVRTSPSEDTTLGELIGPDVEVYYDVQPPYVSSPLGVAIEMVNNDEAADVTWSELVDFLIEDPTDESPYIKDLHMCGAFAEQLHNSAEEVGIRAAWVSIDLRGREIGHALNAFQTLDRGLVFVDCTGADAGVLEPGVDSGLCDHDKVAYVKIGKEYGLISLDRAESPVYEFYEDYSRLWDDYLSELDDFNQRAGEYNDFVSGHSLVAGSEEARHAQQLHNELEATRVALEMRRELLGPCRWNTLGIVERVRIYW